MTKLYVILSAMILAAAIFSATLFDRGNEQAIAKSVKPCATNTCSNVSWSSDTFSAK